MAKTLTSNLVAEKNKLHNTDPWIILLEIELSDTESARICNYQQNVTFDSNTYYAFPFAISSLTESGDGKLPQVGLTVPNVTREIQQILDDQNGLQRKKVWLRFVHSDHLASASDKIEFQLSIQDASARIDTASFRLGRIDLMDVQVPKRRYNRDRCGFVYKDSFTCQYVGDIPTCDHSLRGPNGCTVHGDDEVANNRSRLHPRLYGAFPGIPRQRT